MLLPQSLQLSVERGNLSLSLSLQSVELALSLAVQLLEDMFLMRDERKKQASPNKQTNKQGKATQHTQDSHFSWTK